MYNTEPININSGGHIVKFDHSNYVTISNKNNPNDLEKELKELKKRKFEIDNEFEKKIEILDNLNEENKNLQIINKNLRGKLKGLGRERRNSGGKTAIPSIQQKRNSKESIINNYETVETPSNTKRKSFNINTNFEVPSEIAQVKEELADTELIFKTKKKLYIDIKNKIKTKSNQLAETIKDINDISSNKKILQEELNKLEEEYKIEEIKHNDKEKEKLAKDKNSNNNFSSSKELFQVLSSSEKKLKEKISIDKSINNLRVEIKIKEKLIEENVEKFNQIVKELEDSQNLYALLVKEKYDSNKKIKSFSKYLDKHELFVKNVEAELFNIKSQVNKNKSEFEKIEDELNYKIYFIRFSNSFVRSFFNIINTRRLQIEMIKNLDKQEKQVYDFMFKKLDDLELNLVKEYKEYLILCDEDKEENSMLY